MSTKTCNHCRMDIQIGASVCPFCQRDPRSDTEIELTNAAAAGLAKFNANKTGNSILQMIFFGACLGLLGFIFSNYGFAWLIGGVVLGYLNSAWMNRDQ